MKYANQRSSKGVNCKANLFPNGSIRVSVRYQFGSYSSYIMVFRKCNLLIIIYLSLR